MNIINYFKNGNNNGHSSNHSYYSNSKGSSFVPSPVLYMTPMAPIDYGCPDDMLDDGRSDTAPSSQNTSPMYQHHNLHHHHQHNNIEQPNCALEFLEHHLSFEMKYGVNVSQGNRKYQEDRHKVKIGLENNQYLSLFGVFDGHGGERASNFIKKKIVNCVNKYVKENKAGYSSKNLNSTSSPTGSTSSASSASSSGSSSSSASSSSSSGPLNGSSSSIGMPNASTISPTPSSGNSSTSSGASSSGVSSANSPIGGFDSPGWMKFNHLYNQTNFQQEIQNRSEFLQAALYNTFQFLDNRYCKKYRQKGDGGSTCLVALLSNPPNAQPLLVVANAGDSRGVLCRNGKAHPLSYDHKPGNPKEKQRITSSGGKIEWDYNERIWRVSGILSVSRGIGDIPLKKWVVCDPEFVVFPLKGPIKKSNNRFSSSSAHSSPSSPKAFRSSPQINRFFFSPAFKNKSISNSTGSLPPSTNNSPQQPPPMLHQIHQNHLNNVSSPNSSISSESPSLNTLDHNNINNNNQNSKIISTSPPNHKMYYCSNHQYNYGEVDQFFVLATDGIWDVFENQELVDFINEIIEESYHSKRLDWDPNEISKRVVQEAYRKGSGDNATVLIIKLYW
ncbi:hypothetical protein RB653_002246 [Dictyostelium firmibasis]|uniref:PPM-type phosphatase domain-containing protein n=1 Tax=Dictyostelium firmibasis TaxID=79012 RepID=A0AAN7U2P1_9MYCE